MCVLRVTGKEFDAEKYLVLSTLSAYKVFRAGEPRFMSSPEGKRNEVSGFTVDVSRDSWADLRGQVADAITFLKNHEQALAMLRSAPGVEDIRLDFPVDLRIDRKTVMAQFDYFPPELVSRAGALGLGLEISIYPRDFEQLAQARRKHPPHKRKPLQATSSAPIKERGRISKRSSKRAG
jgi:hypothetical protein